MIIKKIDVLSLGKVLGMIQLILGFIFAIIFAIIGMTPMMVFNASMLSEIMMPMGGFAIIAWPIMLGILGFLYGIVIAYIYNLVSGWVGGIKINQE